MKHSLIGFFSFLWLIGCAKVPEVGFTPDPRPVPKEEVSEVLPSPSPTPSPETSPSPSPSPVASLSTDECANPLPAPTGIPSYCAGAIPMLDSFVNYLRTNMSRSAEEPPLSYLDLVKNLGIAVITTADLLQVRNYATLSAEKKLVVKNALLNFMRFYLGTKPTDAAANGFLDLNNNGMISTSDFGLLSKMLSNCF